MNKVNKDVYLFDIARADDVQWLLALRADALNDDEFHSVEKDEICAAIDRRISAINARAAGKQKPRW